MPVDENGFLGKEIAQWIADIRSAHAEFFALADDVNRHCQSAMYRLAPRSRNGQEILVTTLFIRVLSNYQASILLAERGMMPQSRVLARATIEALFKLCAISKSGKCADEFILDDHMNRLKFLNKYRNFHGGSLPPDVEEKELEALEQELRAEIKAGNVKKKLTEQWSKDAGLHDWYLSAYAVLSDSVHSKVKDLESYLVLDVNHEIKELRCRPDDHDIEKILMTLIQSILTALNCTTHLFGHEGEGESAAFQARLDVLVKERIDV